MSDDLKPDTDHKGEPRIYPCRDCGVMRSKSEGGTTFTVCDECWDKIYKKPSPDTDTDTDCGVCGGSGQDPYDRDNLTECRACCGTGEAEREPSPDTVVVRRVDLEILLSRLKPITGRTQYPLKGLAEAARLIDSVIERIEQLLTQGEVE
jgi:hypothetical protein